MSREKRLSLIGELESKRNGRLLIAYVTSTRSGHEMMIADDILPRLQLHLEAGKEKARKGVDLFIHSNGGSGTAPWRIVNLIREFTEDLAVVVPHHAFSAATLIALGANSIVMHKMGFLGPIDPSVANQFNPPHPNAPGQLLPISVEDVSAYFKLVKEDIGIQHEDELVQALTTLTASHSNPVHPLALGNVQRSHNQSRMLAKKLLKKHMAADQEHEIDTLIDNLKSNLYFHGHPINRREAKEDLKLKVELPSPEVEQLIWDLYLQYSQELKLMEPFNPLHELDVRRQHVPPGGPLTVQQILAALQQMAQLGLAIGTPGVTEEQLVRLAAAMLPYTSGVAGGVHTVKLQNVKGAYLEAVDSTNVFLSDLTLERVKVMSHAGPQDAVRQEPTWQRWEIET